MQKVLTVFHTEFNKMHTEDLRRLTAGTGNREQGIESLILMRSQDDSSLYTAASGMSAQQLNLDTIANNLANSSTTGFRQLRLEFRHGLSESGYAGSGAKPDHGIGGLAGGFGNQIGATEVINPRTAEPDQQSI